MARARFEESVILGLVARRGVAPAALVAAVAIVTWLIAGVTAVDIVLFLAYEIVFVGIPGAALLWMLRGRRSGFLVTMGLGWPLGQTLEILAFCATATGGLRGLFLIYPVVLVAACALVKWKRGAGSPHPDHGAPLLSWQAMWLAAVIISVALTAVASMFLPKVPLPSATTSVYYNPDFPYFIGLIAQVLHHWPPTSPGLYGVPLSYEWFVFFHMAAVAQVTHLTVPIIAFRLDYVPTIIVVGCQMVAVGRLIGRSAWTGVVALAVVFLLGPLDLTTDVGGASPFFEGFFSHLWASWTFPLGLTFILALLYAIIERWQGRTWNTPGDVGSWILIGLLMVGASGAKATVLPVVIGGVGIYGVLALLVRRRLPPTVLITFGVGVVIFIVTFKIVYGGGVPATVIEPFAALTRTAPVMFVDGLTNHPTLRVILLPLAYVAGAVGQMLGLAGMLYLLRSRHRAELARFGLPICMFLAGLLITNVAHQISYSELYFQDTGYVAGGVAAGAGLRLAWMDAGHALPISRRGILLTFIAAVAVVLGLVVLTSISVAHPDALAARYFGVAAACVALVLIWTAVLRSRKRPTSGVLALGLIPIVAATALTFPIQLAPTVKKVLAGERLAVIQPDPQSVWGLTPDLLTALGWLQNHTSVDTVFAVSNHWVDPAKTDGRDYFYSAFSERQAFVEAYDPIRFGITTGLATAIGRNFAYRQQLNNAVFNDADAAALGVLMQQYAVRFLFIDRIHGQVDPAVLRMGRIVFSNADATIVAVG
jgi:hypothetical protein